MKRLFYQWLLWLHPPQFRREFAGEMLWIFESSVESDGAAGLFYDGLRSLGRQWLLRSGSWKIGVALAGAVLQVCVGSLGMLVFTHRQMASYIETAPYRGDWVGNAQSTPIELALGKNPTRWFGSLIVKESDGGGRANPVLDFQPRGGAVSFRVATSEGDFLFRGRLSGGKLAGTFEKLGEASVGVWEVARPGTRPAGVTASVNDLVGITILMVPGVILAVVLLALWTRSFTHKRSHRFKPRLS
jgi:hypothetical protein